jgi:hypothetical protein
MDPQLAHLAGGIVSPIIALDLFGWVVVAPVVVLLAWLTRQRGGAETTIS